MATLGRGVRVRQEIRRFAVSKVSAPRWDTRKEGFWAFLALGMKRGKPSLRGRSASSSQALTSEGRKEAMGLCQSPSLNSMVSRVQNDLRGLALSS